MVRNKRIWMILIVVLTAAGGAYYYYNNVYKPPEEPVEETVQTSRVRRGDLVISASGSGELISADDVNLGFTSGGVLYELMVDVGDRVEAGDVLARLDVTDAQRAVANAEIKLA